MPVTTNLPVPMRALLAGARRKQPALLDLIQKLVRAESPSDDKTAVNACVALAATHAKSLGGRVKLHRQKSFGDLLEARFGPKSKADPTGRILLLGHLDTVWPLGTLKSHALPPRRRPPLGAGHTGHESWRGHGLHGH
jgi:glutamate carboxypeptidase